MLLVASNGMTSLRNQKWTAAFLQIFSTFFPRIISPGEANPTPIWLGLVPPFRVLFSSWRDKVSPKQTSDDACGHYLMEGGKAHVT